MFHALLEKARPTTIGGGSRRASRFPYCILASDSPRTTPSLPVVGNAFMQSTEHSPADFRCADSVLPPDPDFTPSGGTFAI